MYKKYSYRNLILWNKAQLLALEVIDAAEQAPRSWTNQVLVRQTVASATSIGANIAEGHGRFSFGAHRNHLSIAKGSAAETDSWLDLWRRRGWLSTGEEEGLHEKCLELMAMLTSKIHALERLERNNRKLRESQNDYAVETTDEPPYPFEKDDYILDDQIEN